MSGGVGLLARVDLRRRRAGIAWLALLVSLVGTVVVASLSAHGARGRRAIGRCPATGTGT